MEEICECVNKGVVVDWCRGIEDGDFGGQGWFGVFAGEEDDDHCRDHGDEQEDDINGRVAFARVARFGTCNGFTIVKACS